MKNLRRLRLTARSSVKCQYVSLGTFFPEVDCIDVVGNDVRRLVEFGCEAVVLSLESAEERLGSPINDLLSFRQTAANSA